jgi:hypothetical protein
MRADRYCLFLKGGGTDDAGLINCVSVGRIIGVLDRAQEPEIFLLALAEVFAWLDRNDAAKECCRVRILRAS